MSLITRDVTRFPNGISTRAETDILNGLGFSDPTKYHTYFEDFDYYNAANWTVTETQMPQIQPF